MPENTKRDEEITRWMQSKLSLTRSMKDFDPAELTPQDWETIVSRCSNGWDWSGLLQKQPQFADKCPWDKLSGEDWMDLLRGQPQFADKRPPARKE